MVTPSQRLGGSILEPYNAVCGFNAQLADYDLNVQIENEAVVALLKTRLKLEKPGFREINRLIAHLVSSVTLPARNGHGISCLGPNMVPFPRLHFVIPSLAPLISAEQRNHESLALPSMFTDLFSYKSQWLDPSTKRSSCLPITASLHLRGALAHIPRGLTTSQMLP